MSRGELLKKYLAVKAHVDFVTPQPVKRSGGGGGGEASAGGIDAGLAKAWTEQMRQEIERDRVRAAQLERERKSKLEKKKSAASAPKPQTQTQGGEETSDSSSRTARADRDRRAREQRLREDLPRMGVSELRKLVLASGISDVGCLEKSDLLQLLYAHFGIREPEATPDNLRAPNGQSQQAKEARSDAPSRGRSQSVSGATAAAMGKTSFPGSSSAASNSSAAATARSSAPGSVSVNSVPNAIPKVSNKMDVASLRDVIKNSGASPSMHSKMDKPVAADVNCSADEPMVTPRRASIGNERGIMTKDKLKALEQKVLGNSRSRRTDVQEGQKLPSESPSKAPPPNHSMAPSSGSEPLSARKQDEISLSARKQDESPSRPGLGARSLSQPFAQPTSMSVNESRLPPKHNSTSNTLDEAAESKRAEGTQHPPTASAPLSRSSSPRDRDKDWPRYQSPSKPVPPTDIGSLGVGYTGEADVLLQTPDELQAAVHRQLGRDDSSRGLAQRKLSKTAQPSDGSDATESGVAGDENKDMVQNSNQTPGRQSPSVRVRKLSASTPSPAVERVRSRPTSARAESNSKGSSHTPRTLRSQSPNSARSSFLSRTFPPQSRPSSAAPVLHTDNKKVADGTNGDVGAQGGETSEVPIDVEGASRATKVAGAGAERRRSRASSSYLSEGDCEPMEWRFVLVEDPTDDEANVEAGPESFRQFFQQQFEAPSSTTNASNADHIEGHVRVEAEVEADDEPEVEVTLPTTGFGFNDLDYAMEFSDTSSEESLNWMPPTNATEAKTPEKDIDPEKYNKKLLKAFLSSFNMKSSLDSSVDATDRPSAEENVEPVKVGLHLLSDSEDEDVEDGHLAGYEDMDSVYHSRSRAYANKPKNDASLDCLEALDEMSTGKDASEPVVQSDGDGVDVKMEKKSSAQRLREDAQLHREADVDTGIEEKGADVYYYGFDSAAGDGDLSRRQQTSAEEAASIQEEVHFWMSSPRSSS